MTITKDKTMRTIKKEYKVYKFNEATRELKNKIKNYLSDDGSFFDHILQERIETLKALAKVLNGNLDYSISCVPDRGEYIRIKPLNEWNLDFDELLKVIKSNEDCPLTGVCYDHDILDLLSKDGISTDSLKMALDNYLDSIHSEYESMLEDDYINDLCEANDYEFYENGKIF